MSWLYWSYQWQENQNRGKLVAFLFTAQTQKYTLRGIWWYVVSSVTWLGLASCHSPYSLLFTSSDVLYKGNQGTSSNSKQEMGRNILGMNFSFGIFLHILLKFENTDCKRNINVNGFKELWWNCLLLQKETQEKLDKN